jgi:hypothetical protein
VPSLRIRVDPVEKVTTASILQTLSEPEQRRVAAALAKEGIEDAKKTNQQIFGRVPKYETTVDGKKNAPLESVNPARGNITTEFELINDVLVFIRDTLIRESPRRSGDYIRGHKIFADGVEIDIGPNTPQSDEYVFSNIVPYARKIEVGKTKTGRAFVIQVAPKIYERVAQMARARFGNIVALKYTFRDISGGSSAPAIIVRSR